VAVHLAYVSAWSTGDGTVHFRSDIYNLDGPEQLAVN
jgi:murein L,D-transpeptidase YcbB/YkuD